MMAFLHSRSKCDACRSEIATLERAGIWLCSFCDTGLIQFPLTSAMVMRSDVSAPASNPLSPMDAPPEAGAINSESREGDGVIEHSCPAVVGSSRVEHDDGSAAATFPEPGPCGFEFSEFPEFLMRKRTTTFRVVASNAIQEASV